jgi:hypothetical protein
MIKILILAYFYGIIILVSLRLKPINCQITTLGLHLAYEFHANLTGNSTLNLETIKILLYENILRIIVEYYQRL